MTATPTTRRPGTRSGGLLGRPSREAGLNVVILTMAVACGLTVANLYYPQPLLALVAHGFGVSQGTAAIVVTVTQLGYARGPGLPGPARRHAGEPQAGLPDPARHRGRAGRGRVHARLHAVPRGVGVHRRDLGRGADPGAVRRPPRAPGPARQVRRPGHERPAAGHPAGPVGGQRHRGRLGLAVHLHHLRRGHAGPVGRAVAGPARAPAGAGRALRRPAPLGPAAGGHRAGAAPPVRVPGPDVRRVQRLLDLDRL